MTASARAWEAVRAGGWHRWVVPPAPTDGQDAPPLHGAGALALAGSGVEAGSVATRYGQAFVVFPNDSVAPRFGEIAIRVAIPPLDPRTLPAAPPGLHIDGNDYRIEAAYGRSGDVAMLRRPTTVVLRYPVHGLQLYRLTPAGWIPLETVRFQTSLQVFAFTERLGVFAAVGQTPPSPSPVRSGFLLGVAVALLVAVGLQLRRVLGHGSRPRRPRGAAP